MNKREYDRKMKNMGAYAARILSEKFKLEAAWQHACPHPAKKLVGRENVKEDEYGRIMDSWTTYDYKCERCGTILTDVECVRDIHELRILLCKKAAETHARVFGS